ncbi:MAG TPA: ABC transporter, partial [Alphaproteobacteria bacterium]|nr:ABC transporter [Alphaproteobacteria bacterium]
MSSSAQTTGAKGVGKTLLQLKGVSRRYEQGGAVIDVLRNADLDVRGGELTALVGPSGSGKSTLLNVAGLLERPTEGEVIIDGAATGRLGTRRRGRLRGSHIGFVFQFHRLLPEFSAL